MSTPFDNDQEQLLTVKQVADLYGIGESTVRKWTENGTIPPAVKIGAATRWRKSELLAHIRGLERAERLERAS